MKRTQKKSQTTDIKPTGKRPPDEHAASKGNGCRMKLKSSSGLPQQPNGKKPEDQLTQEERSITGCVVLGICLALTLITSGMSASFLYVFCQIGVDAQCEFRLKQNFAWNEAVPNAAFVPVRFSVWTEGCQMVTSVLAILLGLCLGVFLMYDHQAEMQKANRESGKEREKEREREIQEREKEKEEEEEKETKTKKKKKKKPKIKKLSNDELGRLLCTLLSYFGCGFALMVLSVVAWLMMYHEIELVKKMQADAKCDVPTEWLVALLAPFGTFVCGIFACVYMLVWLCRRVCFAENASPFEMIDPATQEIFDAVGF